MVCVPIAGFGGKALSISPSTSLVQGSNAGCIRADFALQMMRNEEIYSGNNVSQVLAVSSAGPTFATMQEIPPFLLSAWRLSMTAMLLIPLGLYQIFKLSPGKDNKSSSALVCIACPSY